RIPTPPGAGRGGDRHRAGSRRADPRRSDRAPGRRDSPCATAPDGSSRRSLPPGVAPPRSAGRPPRLTGPPRPPNIVSAVGTFLQMDAEDRSSPAADQAGAGAGTPPGAEAPPGGGLRGWWHRRSAAPRPTYWLTRFVLLRLLGFVYLFAFLSLATQV